MLEKLLSRLPKDIKASTMKNYEDGRSATTLKIKGYETRTLAVIVKNAKGDSIKFNKKTYKLNEDTLGDTIDMCMLQYEEITTARIQSSIYLTEAFNTKLETLCKDRNANKTKIIEMLLTYYENRGEHNTTKGEVILATEKNQYKVSGIDLKVELI